MASARILLAYHSSEGQSAKIAERIASTLRDGGAEVDLRFVEYAPPPEGYDAVILGDSIHAGRHSRALTRYAARHADTLNSMPLGVFQTSLTSASDDEHHSTVAHQLLQRLLDGTDLEPDLVGLFAGALVYTRYGWLKRRIMRRIAQSEGGDVDTSRDFEYTDWEAVDHFAKDALELVRTAAVPRP